MSNNSIRSQHGKPLERASIDDLVTISDKKPDTSLSDIEYYKAMQNNTLASEAYIGAKKYGLSMDIAVKARELLGRDKFHEFTEFYLRRLKEDPKLYMQAVEFVAKNGFSFMPNEVSLLEQEVMNFQNKFNLDLNRNYYRDRVGSSTHYDEHNATRALDGPD